jgi:hypothetical protein
VSNINKLERLCHGSGGLPAWFSSENKESPY